MVLSELIRAVQARHPDLPPHIVDQVVRRVFAEIADGLVAGSRVELRGFGVFSVSRSKERMVRNPKTGRILEQRSTKAVRFRPSALLAGAVDTAGKSEDRGSD